MKGVSYIITVYNKAPCLAELVVSLKAQVGNFEREFIFIDDGSTDNSLEVLQKLLKDLPGPRVVSQKNKGPSCALNAGLAIAKYDWSYLVDGDDCLHPEATETLLELAEKSGAQVVSGRHSNNPEKDAWRFDDRVNIYDDALAQALRFHPIGASTTMIDRKLALKALGCDERIFVQDYSLALRVSRYAKFAKINKLIAHNISNDYMRVSHNKAQENHDTAAARYFFLNENLDIDYDYKYLVLHLFLRKAWKWHIKHKGALAFWSKHFWRYIASRFDFGFKDEIIMKWMKEGLEVYEGARGAK
jgi:glycosyltransferase involved in cell wall biosynthesis